jgi:hypothetical protein
MLNRSAIVVRPRQPFLDWLHAADPTSRDIALSEIVADPTIYLIPQYDYQDDVHEFLRDLCEEIFIEQLASWLTDEESWPQDRSFDAFCRWFDWQHHSLLIDLCDEPPTNELD